MEASSPHIDPSLPTLTYYEGALSRLWRSYSVVFNIVKTAGEQLNKKWLLLFIIIIINSVKLTKAYLSLSVACLIKKA